MKVLNYFALIVYLKTVISVCPPGAPFCFNVKTFNDTTEFSVSGPIDSGYMAIGLGASMKDAEIFVTYFDIDQQAKVMHRQGVGYTQPQEVQNSQILVSKTLSLLSSENQTIVFTRTSKSSINPRFDINGSGTYPMLWSYAKVKPANNRVTKHLSFGKLDYAFESLLTTNETTSSGNEAQSTDAVPSGPRTPVLIHGILMLISWLALPPIAIFIARFMKTTLGIHWFRLHFGLFILTGILALSSIIVMIVDRGLVIASAHSIIGISVMSIFIFQMALGMFIDQKWREDRTSIPMHDKLHWWLGRGVSLLAVANIMYGIIIIKSPKAFWITAGIIMAITAGAFSYGHVKLAKKSIT